MRNEGHSLATKVLVKMTENVAAGMEYLESKKCIHRLVNGDVALVYSVKKPDSVW